MNPKAAIRKIASFEKRFGQPHLYLAYHAAFPLALTPDLLYRLWANFQRDIDGRFLNIPWIAVSDILLSSLCQEVGQELYEMDISVRNELLKRLQADKNLSQQRISELADFLLEYVRKQLQSNDPDIQDFAKAQRWTVLAYTKPGEAARELASTFQKLGLDASNSGNLDKTELVRMASLVETFAEPLAAEQLEPLLVYARGMASFARGELQKAAEQLEQVIEDGKIQIAGVDLPIPEAIQNNLEQSSPPIRLDFSGQNLQGRSFKGQNLTGANFSNTDIRSTDFTNATLIGANFNSTKAGLQRRWTVGLMLCSLLLLIVSGLSATLVGTLAWYSLYWALDKLSLENENFIYICTGLIGPIIFLILCFTTPNRHLTATWGASALALVGSSYFAGSVAIALSWVGSLLNSGTPNLAAIASGGIAFVSALALTRAIAGRTASRAMGLVAVAVISVLLVTSFISESGASVAVIIALAIVATVLALGLVSLSNRVKTLARTLVIVGIFALLVALGTGVVLIFNQVEVATIAVSVALTAILAIVVVTPLILAGVGSLHGAFMGTLAIPAAIAIFFTLIWANSLFSPNNSSWLSAAIIAEISVLAAALAWAIVVAIATTIALTWAETGNKAIAVTWTIAGTLPLIVGTVVVALISEPWLVASDSFNLQSFRISVATGSSLAGLICLLGTYIGWQTVAKDEKFASILNLANAFAAKGGTSFRGANLSNANFTEATLKSADFRAANLTKTCWFHTQKLDHTSVVNTYLQCPQVQQLVITRMGQAKNFDHLNMQGINLQKANLADSSFIGTNLSEANLQYADLSRAKLIQTNLDKADLFGSCLTGTYIQDVKISNTTKLSGVECQYIFTRVPTKENPDPARIPEDYRQIFQPGEFASFMQSFIETESRR
jgi:uncharacterized protein YjbI with pentapeptide repeats